MTTHWRTTTAVYFIHQPTSMNIRLPVTRFVFVFYLPFLNTSCFFLLPLIDLAGYQSNFHGDKQMKDDDDQVVCKNYFFVFFFFFFRHETILNLGFFFVCLDEQLLPSAIPEYDLVPDF
jgi:hypothetical protein